MRSTISSPVPASTSRRRARRPRWRTSRSPGGSSTSTSPARDLIRLSRGLTPARLARVIAMLDPVELMFALKKLRARRAPANQAHVTNLKENPALLAADAAEAAARGFAEIETTVGVSRYAPLNAIAILVGSQTGRPGVLTQCAVEERLNLRLAIQGLVTYAETLSVYGTEAVFVDGDDTPVVEGVPRLGVRIARGQGALHLGRRLRGADGRVRGQVDALPRGALPVARARGRLAGRAERLDLLRRARPRGPRRDARGAGRERARGLARSRGRLGERRHRQPLGDPQDGEADGPVPAGHRLRHLGLLGDAALRQHVRRRQLRLARPRRVADACSATGRSTPGSSRSTRRARWPCASAAARAVQAVFAELGFPPISDEEVRLATICTRLARPARPRSRRRRPRRRPCARRGDQRARRRARARPPRLPGGRRSGLRDAAPAGRRRLPADLGDHRGRRNGQSRPSTTATTTPARARATGSKARAGSSCAGCPTRSTRGCSAVRRRRDGRRSPSTGPAEAGSQPDEVVIAVGPAFGERPLRDDQRPAPRRRARGDRRRHARRGSRAAHRAHPALGRRRLHRARRRPALGLADRRRAAVEGHRADPPGRPRAARLPRALRHGALADARRRTGRSGATRPATRSAARSRRCRPCSTTTRGRS